MKEKRRSSNTLREVVGRLFSHPNVGGRNLQYLDTLHSAAQLLEHASRHKGYGEFAMGCAVELRQLMWEASKIIDGRPSANARLDRLETAGERNAMSDHTSPAVSGTVGAVVVRIGPCEYLLCCDFCFENETVDCHETGELRPMYRVDDDCVICQRCLDAGKHNAPLERLREKKD